MKPLVSICIPSYQQTYFLKMCLDSVLKQTYENVEIIITDDSKDESVKQLVSSYNNPALQYFHNVPSLGNPVNWNSALDRAKGKYIKIMHHDDYFLKPDSLSKMVEMAETQNADFVFCNTQVWHQSNNQKRIAKPNSTQLKRLKNDVYFLFFRNIIGAPSATLFKNKGLKFDARFKWLVDIEFYIRYLSECKFAYINEALVCTVHEAAGQVTQSVKGTREVELKENVLLYSMLFPKLKSTYNFELYFEYLFRDFDVDDIKILSDLVELNHDLKSKFEKIIQRKNKNVTFKKFIWRLYNSRYNKRYFKLERF